MPLIRSYPEAPTLFSTDAFVLDRIGVGTMFIEGEAVRSALVGRYLAAFEFLGDPPITLETLGGHSFQRAVLFDADFAGASVTLSPENLPAAEYIITIQKVVALVVTDIGTLTIQPDGTWAFAAAGVGFQKDEGVRFIGAATPDVTLARFFWTLIEAEGV